MKSGKGALGIIITIVVMLLVFAGLVFAGIQIGFLKIDMHALNFGKAKEEEKQEEQVDVYSKEYNVDDYVTVSKDDESGIKIVSFKTIEADVLDSFKQLQEKFKTGTLDSGNKKTNVVRTNADKGILSVYTKETIKKADTVVSENSYSANVNIESKEMVKNTELIDLYSTSAKNVSKALINKLVEVSTDITFTDIATNTQIKASDIKINIDKYTSIVEENIEKITMYSRKDTLYADLNSTTLLQILGLKADNATKLVDIYSISM